MALKKYFKSNLLKNIVEEKFVDYKFFPGFSITQKQKNIIEIHKNILKKEGINNKILEVSSKSNLNLGVELSAFNLCLTTKKNKNISVESIFQASKVFENGGPYRDIMNKTSKEAKRDERIKNSGKLISFFYNDEKWELEPKTLFYDWIYINTLWINIIEKKIDINDILTYNIFTDIEFNHEKSLNCQARSLALFINLYKNNLIENVLKNKENFKYYLEKNYQINEIPKTQNRILF